MSAEFQSMELVDGKYMVTWDYIGEGIMEDYRADDPEDEQRLRFSCYEKHGDEFEEIDDTSYCTRMTVQTPRQILMCALEVLMRELRDAREGGGSAKKTMEAMSWICEADFKSPLV